MVLACCLVSTTRTVERVLLYLLDQGIGCLTLFSATSKGRFFLRLLGTPGDWDLKPDANISACALFVLVFPLLDLAGGPHQSWRWS